MRALFHQMFHLFTSRWIPDTWRAGPIQCETRACTVCWRSQFRSRLPGERWLAWMETTERPLKRDVHA